MNVPSGLRSGVSEEVVEAPWEAWPPFAAISLSSSLGRLAKFAGFEEAILEDVMGSFGFSWGGVETGE